MKTLAQVWQEAATQPKVRCIPTGLGMLDQELAGGGLRRGALTLIAGRPSMGKTTLACNIARNAPCPLLFVTLEMSSLEVAEWVGHEVWNAARFGLEDEQCSTESIVDLILQASRGGVELVIIDYIQLMNYRGEENAALTEISRALKRAAKQAEVALVVLSQLNRDCEQQGNTRPRLHQLRGSGSLEQDADLVLTLWSECEYRDDGKTELEITIAKQRFGRRGQTVTLDFDRANKRIRSLDAPPAVPVTAQDERVFFTR